MIISPAIAVQEYFEPITYWRKKKNPWSRIIQLLGLDGSAITAQDLSNAYTRELMRRGPAQRAAIAWALENHDAIKERLDERATWYDIVREFPFPEHVAHCPTPTLLRTAFLLVDADQPDKSKSACPSPGEGHEWWKGGLIVKLFRSHGVRTSYSAIAQAAKQLPPDKARRVMRQIEKTERDTGLSWAIPSGEAEETEYGEEDIDPEFFARGQDTWDDLICAINAILEEQQCPPEQPPDVPTLLRAILVRFDDLYTLRKAAQRHLREDKWAADLSVYPSNGAGEKCRNQWSGVQIEND
ncbi:MAG: hypothetical protein M0Z39_05010 [Actinomycetota bacterium]|jgi:hypothetical protein|nr:hypothetical protein [Actinomycetota bacterium]